MPPSVARLDQMTGGAHRPAHDFEMRAAAAEIVAQRLADLSFRWSRCAQQQRLRGHDHAVEAIAALRGLLADERVLHGIGMLARAEAFECYDVAAFAPFDRDHAGARSHAVDQHGAGSALA